MRSHQNIVSGLWGESKNRIRGFIARRVDNDSDVEDILQNVFLKIHQNIGELRDAERLQPWVFQIARNAIIDYYRDQGMAASPIDDTMGIAASEPEHTAAEEEVLSWLEPMAGELPEKYRDALILADIEGLTQQEVSKRLNISLSGAKSRVQRARAQLKEILVTCCRIEFDRAGTIVEYKQQADDCRACSN